MFQCKNIYKKKCLISDQITYYGYFCVTQLTATYMYKRNDVGWIWKELYTPNTEGFNIYTIPISYSEIHDITVVKKEKQH